MEDLYRLKEYNSARWSVMAFEDIKAELDEASCRVAGKISRIRQAKMLITAK